MIRVIQLFKIPPFDFVERLFAPKQVRFDLRNNFSWHGMKLVVRNFPPRYCPSRRNQMGPPLKNQSEIPNHKNA